MGHRDFGFVFIGAFIGIAAVCLGLAFGEDYRALIALPLCALGVWAAAVEIKDRDPRPS